MLAGLGVMGTSTATGNCHPLGLASRTIFWVIKGFGKWGRKGDIGGPSARSAILPQEPILWGLGLNYLTRAGGGSGELLMIVLNALRNTQE